MPSHSLPTAYPMLHVACSMHASPALNIAPFCHGECLSHRFLIHPLLHVLHVLHLLCLPTILLCLKQPWPTLPRRGAGPRLRRRQRPNCVTAVVPVPHPKSSALRRSQPARVVLSVAQPATTSPPSVLAANNHPTLSAFRLRHPTSTPLMLSTASPGPPRCLPPPQRPRLHPLLFSKLPPTETPYCPPPQNSFMDSSPPSTLPCSPTLTP
jgi:hypothetical protein